MAETLNHEPRPKLFSLGQVIFGSIIGSPVAGLIMMTWNHFAIKEKKRAYLTLLIGVAVLLIYFAATASFLHRIPSIFHVIIPAILFGVAAYFLQGHVENKIMEGAASRVTIPIFILVCFSILLAAFVVFYIVIRSGGG